MTYSLSNKRTKHYYNRTPTIQVIVEDGFFETQSITAFAFPAEAGPHLPTPDGEKAELA